MIDRLMRAGVRAALASDWMVRLLARKRTGGVDAALDRQIAAVLELQRIARLPTLDSMEPARARKFAEEGLSPLDLAPAAMAEVIDTTLVTAPGAATNGSMTRGNDVPVRIFVPHDAGRDWLVYFHGGGGVIGSIVASEPVTRYLAARTRCTVASVGYRLGPEHRHPAAIDDANAAWRGIVARVPAGGHVAVGGDSFGGFLSVHVDHDARARGERRPDLQVLIYPCVDLTFASPSIERLANGYLLTEAIMHWFRSNYLRSEEDRRTASPWFWRDDELVGAAPAIVVTAGYDPLVEEGEAWGKRLAAAGVAVRHHGEASLIHGFISFAGAVRAARAAVDRICDDVVEMLHG